MKNSLQLLLRQFPALILLFFLAPAISAQVPTPADFFGFEPGANYQLADNEQLENYYRAVAESSDRVILEKIGETHNGRNLLLMTISSPENLERLDHYRSISERLAKARDLNDDEARELSREGKTVVWIDSGLHSTELATSQHNPHLVYHMATDNSAETRRFLEDVILLNMPVMNPDGHTITVDWYRSQKGTAFEGTRPPVVYHEYIGHDNNRDWYMLLQNESKAVASVLYERWFPQIVVNHHQMGQMPPRMFIPPFDDPVNPNIPALAVRGTNLVGEHMGNRFAAENKPGIIQGISFNMWWNGGMRTVPYFHNMVGILTESTHSSPIPRYWEEEDIPETLVRGSKQIPMKQPSVFYPDPWQGGWSSIGQMVDYHLTASLAVLDIASKRKEDWLYNIYQMGRDAIAAGKEGSPFAYIIPPDQWDAPEAVEMLTSMKKAGVEIHKASSSFSANGHEYPAGSYILYAGQAFRAYLIDLLEPQHYPDRRLYPDGPPEPPYDLAGWTLSYQMGVQVDRIDEPLEINTVSVDAVEPFPTEIQGQPDWGYLIPSRSAKTSLLINELLASGATIYRTEERLEEGSLVSEPGAFLVEGGGETGQRIETVSREQGLSVTGLREMPDVNYHRVAPPRVGLYRSWTANMDEGWTRWVFDNYGFDYTTLTDRDIRSGDLSDYDIIILPAQSPRSLLRGNEPGRLPEEYTGGLGAEGALALKAFAESGGTLLAWDSATDFLIDHLGLPVRDRLRNASREDFFIPGSLVKIETDLTNPIAYGIQPETAAFFVTRGGSHSRSFTIIEPSEHEEHRASDPPVEVISRYATEEILLSGWALGEDRYLAGEASAVRVGVQDGQAILIGFRPQFRAQPRATFNFLFNAIYAASSENLPQIRPQTLSRHD